jgi:hypothetical protein
MERDAMPKNCRFCERPIRPCRTSVTGWEHWSGDPAKGWQGLRCPSRMSGAEPDAKGWLDLVEAGWGRVWSL